MQRLLRLAVLVNLHNAINRSIQIAHCRMLQTLNARVPQQPNIEQHVRMVANMDPRMLSPPLGKRPSSDACLKGGNGDT